MNIADLPPHERSMSAPGSGPAPADPYRQARDALRPIILATARWRPRCASRKDRSRILPQVDALGMPWVQLNPPLTQHWLQFDIDRGASSHAWADANLPFCARDRGVTHAPRPVMLLLAKPLAFGGV